MFLMKHTDASCAARVDDALIPHVAVRLRKCTHERIWNGALWPAHLSEDDVMQMAGYEVNTLATSMPVIDGKERRLFLATKAIDEDKSIFHFLTSANVLCPSAPLH